MRIPKICCTFAASKVINKKTEEYVRKRKTKKSTNDAKRSGGVHRKDGETSESHIPCSNANAGLYHHLESEYLEMRYMLDTNIVIYLTTDWDSLSTDVRAIIKDYNNLLYISAETTRELIVGYRKKSFAIKQWKSCEDLIDSLSDYYHLEILPIDKNVAKVHARLEIKSDHKDPSDHTIISHAIATKMPLISSDDKFPFYQKQGLQLIYNKK